MSYQAGAICAVLVGLIGAGALAQTAPPAPSRNPESQLPPGDVAAGMKALAAAPKVLAPEPTLETAPRPYEQLSARPMWIEKIREGLYVIRGPIGPCMNACRPGAARDGVMHEPGDVAVRVTNAGVILVDDKFAQNVPQIVQLVKSVTPQPIRYLVNSHYHADHAGGDGAMLARGVVIVDQAQLRDSYARSRHEGDVPHVVFGDYGAIDLGGVEVQMYHFGAGHTRGDTIVYFPDLKIVHVGDLVIEGMPHIDYPDGGSAVGMLNEIYSVLRLDWDYAIPGHGRLLSRQDLRDYARKLETMNARMRQIVIQGIPRSQAAAALKLDDLGWADSVSTSTFLGNDVGYYYDEMARGLGKEKAGADPQ
jgi:glyoxylase-like metal-dependent hydrolase (beta-lactamase superfamily II)